MRLHHFGSGRPRVGLLHGFTQQGEHMKELAQLIGASCVAPDLPGHGPDPHLPATMAEAVDRVVEMAADLEMLVGYSMGGRVALRAAQRLPDLKLLVLVSATAGVAEQDAPARRAADEALAVRFETEPLAWMVDEWRKAPMFSGMESRSPEWRTADRERRLAAHGPTLAASLRGMGQGVSGRVADAELAALPMSVLCMAGADDVTYAREAERMAEVIPNGSTLIHQTAGHAVLAEDPGWVALEVRRRL